MRIGHLAASLSAIAGLFALTPVTSARAEHHHHHHSHKKAAPEPEPAVEVAAPTAETVDQPAAANNAPPPPAAPVAPVGSPAESYVPTPAGGRPIATVVVLESHIPPRAAVDLNAGFSTALSSDVRIRYRPLAALLDPPDAASRDLAAADQALKDAGAAFDAMELEKARPAAEAAVAGYQRRIKALARDNSLERLRDAWVRLSAVRFFDGNNDGARDALRHALVIDPKLEYSAEAFPPPMKKSVGEARLLFEALGTGVIQVSSTPAGAAVYLNGIQRGRTPFTINDAPAGPNLVTVERAGLRPDTAEVEVPGGDEVVKREVELQRYDSDPQEVLDSVRSELGAPTAPDAVLDAAKALRADMIAIVRPAGNDGAYTLVGYLYDQRSRQLLRKATRKGKSDELGETAKLLAGDLFQKVRFDGRAVAVARQTPSGPSLGERMSHALTDFRDSRAFWPVIGGIGGAVVVGGALGLGLGLGLHHPTTAEELILLGAVR